MFDKRTYLTIAGTFYYLCSILDGFSRAVVRWEIREAMREADVETILQRGRELHPGAKPRVISDNGPQFIARDFKEFVCVASMTRVRTSPYYPQSNGKIERWHRTNQDRRHPPNAPKRQSKTPEKLSPRLSITTTTGAFTAPSASSSQPTRCAAAATRFRRHEIGTRGSPSRLRPKIQFANDEPRQSRSR